MNSVNKENFRIIRKAIENDKLAIFIGSAVSYDSNLPSWGDLINLMKSSLDSPKTDDYLKIAEHYYLQYGKNSYYSKIKEFFPNNSQYNKIHELVLGLKPKYIVTTNWDDLIEKAIFNNGELYFRVANDHELASSPGSKLLIKMHGDINLRNIVFKESDYLSYTDNFPLIENFIKSLFSTHVVLFIGYSISDYNLNQILGWVRNRTQDAPPAFTILTENSITLSEANYLREKGVYPILHDESLEYREEYPTLSSRSNKVAALLENIVSPDRKETLEVLVEIYKDISDWELVHPVNLVRILKDRFEIISVNKIYFDSSENAIVYHVSKEKHSRNTFRPIRKALKNILSLTPIDSINIKDLSDGNRFYRIRNTRKFCFLDEYTRFDFETIDKRTVSFGMDINQSLEKRFQFSFDSYFLKNLSTARESYQYISHLFFSKSQFVKSLVCAFNKKQLCFGEIPWDIADSFFETSMKEQLSKNDNISEMMSKFPKSITARNGALFHDLDANNSFLLERFKNIAIICRKIDEEIFKINKGVILSSDKMASLYNHAYCTVIFILKNKIASIYSSDFKAILNITFESLILMGRLKGHLNVDVFLSFIALFSYRDNGLFNFLSESIPEDNELVHGDDTIDYLIDVLANCLKTISRTNNRVTVDHAKNTWINALTLLSFSNNSTEINKKIINHLECVFNLTQSYDLANAINRFLVLQVSRYENNFEIDGIKNLIRKQIEKINSSSLNIYKEREGSQLFSNLLHLIKASDSNSIDIFNSDPEFEKFIMLASTKTFSERLRLINSFVYTIYFLSTGSYKEKVEDFIKRTFNESKSKEFNEELVIFGLNLFNLNIIQEDELVFILNKLRDLAKTSIENRSSNSAYITIKELLTNVNSTKIVGDYDEVSRNVSELSEKIKQSPFFR